MLGGENSPERPQQTDQPPQTIRLNNGYAVGAQLCDATEPATKFRALLLRTPPGTPVGIKTPSQLTPGLLG